MSVTQIPAGGTGAPTAAGARVKLGLVLGQDVMPFSPNLESISEFSTNGFVVYDLEDGEFVPREIEGTDFEIVVDNSDGVLDNPKISLPEMISFIDKEVVQGTFYDISIEGGVIEELFSLDAIGISAEYIESDDFVGGSLSLTNPLSVFSG